MEWFDIYREAETLELVRMIQAESLNDAKAKLVAFRIKGEFHIIKNYWGSTTGKHLNWICADKSIREDEETFEQNYKRLMQTTLKEAV